VANKGWLGMGEGVGTSLLFKVGGTGSSWDLRRPKQDVHSPVRRGALATSGVPIMLGQDSQNSWVLFLVPGT
jgi:hypothetical protein